MGIKKRCKNKIFWVTLIPALLLLTKQIAALCGIEIDVAGLERQAVDIVDTIFVVLACIGVAVDPTTPGIRDGDKK